jgi:hypothetical protein
MPTVNENSYKHNLEPFHFPESGRSQNFEFKPNLKLAFVKLPTCAGDCCLRLVRPFLIVIRKVNVENVTPD